MIEVDLSKKDNKFTICLYGGSRSGKTCWAASTPSPIFFMDPVERGWTTIQSMNPEWFYDPNVPPTVWAWEKPTEMKDMIGKLQDELKKKPGKYKTLVIDQITWYAERVFAFYEDQISGGKVDTRAMYGNLRSHLQNLVVQLHALPINIVWVGLSKLDANNQGEFNLLGSASDFLPAQCQYWLYQRSYVEKGQLHFATHTQRYGVYPAGCRDGGLLPPVLPECSYKAFATCMGWE